MIHRIFPVKSNRRSRQLCIGVGIIIGVIIAVHHPGRIKPVRVLALQISVRGDAFDMIRQRASLFLTVNQLVPGNLDLAVLRGSRVTGRRLAGPHLIGAGQINIILCIVIKPLQIISDCFYSGNLLILALSVLLVVQGIAVRIFHIRPRNL